MTYLVTLIDRKNVKLARFARNVEWDFFRDFPTFPTLNQWRLKSIEIPYWIDSLSLVDIYCLQIVEKRGGAAIYTDFNNGGLLEWIMRLDEQLKKIIIDFHFSLPFLSFDAVLTAKWVILSKYEKSDILK